MDYSKPLFFEEPNNNNNSHGIIPSPSTHTTTIQSPSTKEDIKVSYFYWIFSHILSMKQHEERRTAHRDEKRSGRYTDDVRGVNNDRRERYNQQQPSYQIAHPPSRDHKVEPRDQKTETKVTGPTTITTDTPTTVPVSVAPVTIDYDQKEYMKKLALQRVS